MTPAALTQWLAARSLSQRRLAGLLGVGQQTVNNWCMGHRPIPGWLPRMLELLERDKRVPKIAKEE